MRLPASAALALRAVESLSVRVPASAIALLAPTPTAARELANLCAAAFPLGGGAHELRVLSPAALLRLAYDARARAGVR